MTMTKHRASASPKRPMPTDPDALLTKDECAQMFGVNRRWLERAYQRGDLPYVRMGKLVRIRLSDARAYIETHTVEAK